ncbi:LacI family DNA-binding transcriptional regulator [Halioxenophilus aromaticivorans]|uniref:Ribose operon transcriptional repressor RbsR n=1 Tax=Halioxenophilus aromaticivorans TaxID=1306992 RepID=A0AAV3U779_9ALTE
MPKQRVTTQDIAQRAGVSKATVSYALNGTGSVSPAVAAKIIALAKEMGYQENRLAKATRTGKTDTLGLVLPDLCNPFFPKMAQAVVQAASERGYSVFLVDCRNSLDEEQQGIERLAQYAIEGIIWCPIDDEKSIARNTLTCPVVMTDRPIDGYDCVYADSASGGALQAQMLSQKGHKKIGLISGPVRSRGAQIRRQGFVQALPQDVSIVWEYSLEYNMTIPAEVQAHILAGEVSCIVAANDTQAIGILRVLHAARKAVPDEVSLIGFDAIEWSDLVSPPLSTIALPIQQIGTESVHLLLERIDNPDKTVRQIALDVQSLDRESLKQL